MFRKRKCRKEVDGGIVTGGRTTGEFRLLCRLNPTKTATRQTGLQADKLEKEKTEKFT